MNCPEKPAVILIAEDDDDDFLLTQEAFEEYHLRNAIYRVKNGEELLDYLQRKGPYAEPEKSPRPTLILLDLNMPKMDGREALKQIKSLPNLRRIPVVVLTTSDAEEDIAKTYELGVNSFIRKPVSFEEFLKTIRTLKEYWLEIVALPTEE
ncbi:MAG: response regulator [Desulfobulbaceae bacterium]|nr:response regulator [Desulfobulbaceae bacterium]HIJ89497.1 response regulator [Deltaproteobacteria bacterium]